MFLGTWGVSEAMKFVGRDPDASVKLATKACRIPGGTAQTFGPYRGVARDVGYLMGAAVVLLFQSRRGGAAAAAAGAGGGGSLADAVRGGIAVMAAVVYCRAAATMRETMETEVGVEVGTGVFYAGLAAFTTYVGAGMVGRKVEATGKVKVR